MKHLNSSVSLVIAACIFAAMASCSGNAKLDKANVKPQSTNIQGYLGNYLEVVDGTYKLDKDNGGIFSWVVKLKIKAKAPYKDNDYGLKDGNGGPLYLDLYDDKGSPLTGFDNLESSYEDDSKLSDILKAGTGETWVTFTKFHTYGQENLPANIAAFTISSKKIEKHDKEASNDSDASSSSTGEKMDNKKWDKIIDDYRSYMMKYIVLVKKAKKGDQTAIAEYPEMLSKAQDLETELKDADKELTATQQAKFLKMEADMMVEISKINQ